MDGGYEDISVLDPFVLSSLCDAVDKGELERMPDGYRTLGGGISGALTGLLTFPDGSTAFFKYGERKDDAISVVNDPYQRTLMDAQGNLDWCSYAPDLTPPVSCVRDDPGAGKVLFVREDVTAPTLRDLTYQDADAAVEGYGALMDGVCAMYARTRATGDGSSYLTDARYILELARENDPAVAALLENDTITINGEKVVNPLHALDALESHADLLTAPFSTWTHGDFHGGNLTYDPAAGRAGAIDFEWSKVGDYANDGGTFQAFTSLALIDMSSVTVTDDGLSYDIVESEVVDRVCGTVHERFSAFARENGDATYDDRQLLVQASKDIVLAGAHPDRKIGLAGFGEGIRKLDELYRRLERK
ncbi:MAG: phosphotransferase [Methanopyri archaeon]|jgi:hypothetical protein|nr:phosphotransferase [Methanopyri archaeon]